MARLADLQRRVQFLYERHTLRWHLAFFAAGFIFDVVATNEGIDHPLIIVQQVVYLSVVGAILYVDFIREALPGSSTLSHRLERWWAYRGLLLHFCLGTLMNLYSIFFLMSASFWSSIAFVLLLAGAVVLNELEVIRRRGVDVKIGLFVLCVFCFWSLLVPLLARRVGLMTFAGALVATLGVLWLFHHLLRRRLGPAALGRRLLVPGLSVSTSFLVFYLVGLIPPVPIAARKFAVYHGVERDGSAYVLRHERPWWKFWQAGDQSFAAQPGDAITVFAAVFSPARFDDTVYIRWQYHDARTGWRDSDRIPIRITGGREGGFRGFTTKQNYTPGDWRVMIETRDGREISRLYITVTSVAVDPGRVFSSERY